MTREELLQKAAETVCGSREQAHGNPANTFKRIARLWTTYLQNKDVEILIDEADVSLMMVLFKIARLQGNMKHEDSWVDAIGYLTCGAEVETEE